MSYPTRVRERPTQYTPGQSSSYGTPNLSLNGLANGGRSNSPYPARNNTYATPTRSGPTRGPGRPPLNRDLPPAVAPPLHPAGLNPAASSQPQQYHRPASHPPGPLPYFVPPPGQPTRDPTYPPPVSQGLYTTYPSRLRTGVTGLVQPETITGGPREREQLLADLDRELAIGRSGSGASTPRVDSPAPFGSSRRAAAAASGRRGRGVVSYAEKGSDDESEEDEEEDEESDIQEAASDPDDTDYGRAGKRRSERDRSGAPGTGTPSLKPFSQMGIAEQQATIRARKLKKKQEEAERGWTWLGDRAPGERVRSQAHRGTKHQYTTEEALEREADKPESLVPITIDFDVTSNNPDVSGIKIKDRFLWNMNEMFLTPHQFSIVFCDDLGISSQQYAPIVAELIQNQLEETQGMMDIDVVDPECTEDDVVWSEDEVEDQTSGANVPNGNGHAAPTPKENALDDGVEEEEEETEQAQEQVKVQDWKEADCRIIVNLDVQIYAFILRDRIEWDLSSSLPPSIFAKEYCRELGLTGEAIPLIAHAITDELLKHKRDALELELFAKTHPEEQAKWDKTYGGIKVNSRYGAKGLVGVWRDWWEREEYGPVLVELSTEEMERREVERTREARRMMRTLATNKRRRA